MARHHQSKRAASRSSASSLATLVTVALLTHGTADLALARRDDSSSSHGRRARAAGSVRGGGSIGVNGTVNLLVKYKNSLAQTRSLGNIDSNDSPLNTWQAHITSTSTISEERHISSVEIDASEINLVWEEMMADEDVELVEEDFPMYKTPYNSIQQDSSDSDQTSHLRHKDRHLKQQQNRTLMESQQYGIAQIQASAVWALTKKYPNKYPNTPVKVCIIDTGYDGSHEDLPTVGVTGTNTGYGDALQDGDGHGTHCAGVIGAVGDNGRGIVGVNPDPTKFSFHIVKALNDDGMGTASSVLKGIQGCISSGAKIISMSLGGGPKSPMFDALYEEAYDKNILVFAAAGNVGVMRDDFPASYPLVVSVGAVDKNGNRADFSNWNDQLELMGPGVDIYSTFPGSGYGMLSGTSMATPYVAGVAALVWGYFPQCSNQQMRNVLAKTAKSLTTNGSDCNRKTGFGLVQAKEAFDLLDKYGCAAGGEDFSPPSAGGVGGCGQPLADTTKLTPVSKLNTASVLGGASSDNGCKKLSLKLLTDDYAYETSWELKRVDNGKLLNNGPPGNRKFADKTEYNGPASGCLDPGTYEFAIKDIYGDGITAPGFYSITLDGRTLARNSNFGPEQITRFTINKI
mmetsp:Transcript_38199/g.70109  ORF Transcript_38199/g.70109 Transcript_38199/m.70109 type:complete len:629 (+) Transcript_38199:208-2094(+)